VSSFVEFVEDLERNSTSETAVKIALGKLVDELFGGGWDFGGWMENWWNRNAKLVVDTVVNVKLRDVKAVGLKNFAGFDEGFNTHALFLVFWKEGSTEAVVDHAEDLANSETVFVVDELVFVRKSDTRNNRIVSAWNNTNAHVKVLLDGMGFEVWNSFGLNIGGNTAFKGDTAVNALLENFRIFFGAGSVTNTLSTTFKSLTNRISTRGFAGMDGKGNGLFTNHTEGFGMLGGWEAVFGTCKIKANNVLVTETPGNTGNVGVHRWIHVAHGTKNKTNSDWEFLLCKTAAINGSFDDLRIAEAFPGVEGWGKTKFKVCDSIGNGIFAGFVDDTSDGIGILHNLACEVEWLEIFNKTWAIHWNFNDFTELFKIICDKLFALFICKF